MPMFAYECRQCGFEKDVLVRPNDDGGYNRCPNCGIREGVPEGGWTRKLSAPAFNLKGVGCYKPGPSR